MNREINWTGGLIPAIVQEADSGRVLMLAYMNPESWAKTLATKQVTFYSRSRQALWTKGETSGHTLEFISSSVDCDGDTILIQARPQGPTCHLENTSCFHDKGEDIPPPLAFLADLEKVIQQRFAEKDESHSYIKKLILRGIDRMAQKVGEEAVETVIAAKNSDRIEFEGEAADLLFHLLILLRAKDSSLISITQILADRHKRRIGEAAQ